MEEEERAVTSRTFIADGHPLEMVTYFIYLGRVISAADDDWLAVVRNLAKVRSVWRSMTRILIKEVERPQVSGFFFKAVVQSSMLFGVETWVVTGPPSWDGSWGFPVPGGTVTDREAPMAVGIWEVGLNLSGAARADAGFEITETYIQ